jgi:hypothetical protein
VSKFSNVLQGPRARKPIKLPLPGAQVDPETGEWIGPTADLDVRPLREDEYTGVLKEALAFARKNGLTEPGEGDPLYEQGMMIHTLAVTCIDRESPKEDPQPFFDGGWEQIFKSEVISPEVLHYLYNQQQLWQDEVSPLLKTMNQVEFIAAAIKVAGGDQSFFVCTRPGMLWSFMHTLAKQLHDSLLRNSVCSKCSEPLPETTS